VGFLLQRLAPAKFPETEPRPFRGSLDSPEELGCAAETAQAGFPDCEAKRRVAPGAWQRVQIEFELESRNSSGTGIRCSSAT
jgi:hypothetical protein